ncbi:MAG TPA: 2-C-methyl-D-erythritol 2,4-cyclodiphosphate synthase [Thermoanaerobaculia bacterium]|nr:2-C-methyl-D-erythritol 2,4-cyclodiphosphate synthase [Thermoanaerobaculia bacterium]HUM28779.1 2-C-methyl-D-erythritol 2,4-cyclodiphosphate synthase [Thermoanaerobaculia bacterium]HXK67971.1 2-C-methyl-D-erythritol 2,4-cyclodiphosphate synthase [Thermoanaerobaculia bacterium]
MTSNPEYRHALGYDAHPFREGRTLYLCGVRIDSATGLDGNSDADAALHALMDALLGAASLGDIGVLFPPDDPACRDQRSTELLQRVLVHIREQRPTLRLTFLDMTIICRTPRLQPFREALQRSLCQILTLSPDRVSVKFGSGNSLGFPGRGEGIAAFASVTVTL